METLTIDRDVLDELASSREGSLAEGLRVVQVPEFYSHSRWEIWFRLVVQDEDGRFWAGIYSVPATESQERDTGPIALKEVHSRQMTITVYD